VADHDEAKLERHIEGAAERLSRGRPRA